VPFPLHVGYPHSVSKPSHLSHERTGTATEPTEPRLDAGRIPATPGRGTPVTATWSGIANPTSTDWIGLYAAGAPTASFLDWVYVN
jgi:hypothetical protein